MVSILLSIPKVQTSLGRAATNYLRDEFKVDINVEKVNLAFLGDVELNEIFIRDHHLDTLIYAKNLTTSIFSYKNILNNKLEFGQILLEDFTLNIKTYENETDDALTVFVDKFDDGSTNDKPSSFLLTATKLKLKNGYVTISDENVENENPLFFKSITGETKNFRIQGPNVSTEIKNFSFIENHNLKVESFTTDFTYTKSFMNFENTELKTKESSILADIKFTYDREDFSDFNNLVVLDASVKQAAVSLIDLKNFYNEFGSDDVLHFSTNINGTLNNFVASDLQLETDKNALIYGDINFKNVFNQENGFSLDGEFSNLTSDYNHLKTILPNALGNALPSEFEKLGRFTLIGKTYVAPNLIDAKLTLKTDLGTTVTDLVLTNINNIDNASYKGHVKLIDFKLGEVMKDSLVGLLTMEADIDGKGFTFENLNVSVNGKVSKHQYKNYTYNNITLNGVFKNKHFDGEMEVNDANIKLNFNGLADLSSEIHKFDFKSDIKYLNLKETKLFTRDSIAVLKGNLALDVEGNTLDDITGKATFKNILYKNQKATYNFKKFNITSLVKDSIKRIEVVSKDITNGYLSGKFSFAELLPVAQNALGSIYTNYTPYAVAPNQFLDFNFTIYNQIVAVFFPDISIDDKTKIKGKIKADKNQLKLTISSPKIDVYGNEIKNILLRTDNQNPLYNSHLTASEVNTKYYNVSKLNLLSLNQNDTLYFKSVFKGGKKKNEDFNLDFFYTFNPEGKSVVGLEKSSFKFKENVWNINPDKLNTNKITFKLKENDFNFSQFKLTSGEQKVAFTGNIKGDTEKILLADFTKVKLQSFLPVIDSLDLKGTLSGSLDFVQKQGNYSPEALLSIKDFEVNNFKQGDLFLNVKGNNSYEKYNVDLSISNKKVKSIAATGSLDFSEKRPLIDLEVYLDEFGLDAFSPLGQDVLSSIRGTASGDFYLRGFLGNPEMEGALRLKNAGLKFPYLNVDYNFEGESVVTLQEQSFIFESIPLKDSKHNSTGKLIGDITHLNFEKWFLNIEIEADNLLVLDTENTDEALYYGTAFMNGNASITGLTDQLTIDINAKTMPGTTFVVPLKDIETIDSYSLIHFKSKETKVKERQEEVALEAIKGLSLNIDLEVTKDATAQVVIDEVYGSQLAGNGKGNLRIEINTRGKFNIFGDYNIDNGVYDFKYGGIVNKPFLIQKGGTVSWNGDPYEANLEVTAIYKAKANPGVLLQNFNSNRKIEVDLVTKITGGLFSSKQDLNIELTNVDPTIASELEFILNDNNVNEKTTQFISLLAFGNFVNPDKVDFNAGETISNTASSAVAAAFSSLLNNPDSKFQLGLDYQQGNSGNDVDRLNTDNQVDVSVSTQVSDRVIINGKVGVPVGAQTQSSVVGEVKVEVLLNKEGNFRGVIFNRQNEIQYSTEEEGYTQGVGLSYQVNFNSLLDLLKKISGKKKQKKKLKSTLKKDTLNTQKNSLINFEGN